MQGNRNKGTIWILLLLTSFLMMSVPIMVFAQDSDSATGTVTVGNSAPTATSVEYVSSTYSIVTAYDPDNTAVWGVNFTLTDANTLSDIDNVTVYLYDDSVHSGDYSSVSPNGYDLITLNWVESTDTWVLDDGAFTEWTESTSVDPGTAYAGTTFEFTARFDISRGAYADTDWRATVIVYDDQMATDTTSAAGTVTMNVYLAISWSSSTFAYGSVTALSANNTMVANRTLTIYANAQWELRFQATDFTAGGEPDVDIATVDTLVWSEGAVANTGNSAWVRNVETTGLGTWDNQARMSATETPFSRDVHLWFTDTGDYTADVEYSVTVTMWVYENV